MHDDIHPKKLAYEHQQQQRHYNRTCTESEVKRRTLGMLMQAVGPAERSKRSTDSMSCSDAERSMVHVLVSNQILKQKQRERKYTPVVYFGCMLEYLNPLSLSSLLCSCVLSFVSLLLSVSLLDPDDTDGGGARIMTENFWSKPEHLRGTLLPGEQGLFPLAAGELTNTNTTVTEMKHSHHLTASPKNV